MDCLPTDIYGIFVQYMYAGDVFNLSKINKKSYQRMWKNDNVWHARKLSIHKERSADIQKHLLYYCDKKPIEILKHAAKYGHDVLFLQLFHRLLNTIRAEGAKLMRQNQHVHIEFDQNHQEMCHALDLAYYYILIGPHIDILLTLLDETLDFIPSEGTHVPYRRGEVNLSYGETIYKKQQGGVSTSHDNYLASYGYGMAVLLSICHERYDTARIFIKKGIVRLPLSYVSFICDKLLMHQDIYIPLLRYNNNKTFYKSLLQACHKLARIDILDTLTDKMIYIDRLVIYRVILKKLIKEKKYDYIMHFMKVCYIKTIKDIAELSDDKLKEKISKNKELMKLKTIGTRFAIKSESDSESESETEKQYSDICRGKTKTGKNCTRKVNKGEYCWQHKK